MAAATAAEVKQGIADALQCTTLAELYPGWDRIIPRAIDAAIRDIDGILGARGWTPDQIAAWNRYHSIHESQSVYWAFVLGAGLQNFDDKWVNKMDMRSQMKELAITDSGGPTPVTSDGVAPHVGVMDETGDRWTENTPM